MRIMKVFAVVVVIQLNARRRKSIEGISITNGAIYSSFFKFDTCDVIAEFDEE